MMTTTTGSLTLDDFQPAADRRRVQRHKLERPVHYLVLCGDRRTDQYAEARLSDVSADGIGIITTESLPRGARFSVKLLADEMVLLIYVVSYCNPVGKAEFRVGARLDGFIGSVRRDDPDWVYHAIQSAADQAGGN